MNRTILVCGKKYYFQSFGSFGLMKLVSSEFDLSLLNNEIISIKELMMKKETKIERRGKRK